MHRVTRGGTIWGRRGSPEDVPLHRNKLLLLLLVLGFVLQACGTRLSKDEFALKAGTANQGANASDQTGAGDQGGDLTGTGSTGTEGQEGTASSTGQSGGGQGTNGSKTGGGTNPSGGGGGASGPNTASDVGVTPSSIKIGNITSIQGQFGPDAFSGTLYGLSSYVSSINARGGINGRKIDFKTCDDRDTGDGNLACSQRLIDQDKIFAFLGNNSQSSSRSANFSYSKGVPDLGPPLNNGYNKYPTMYSFYGANGHPRNGKEVGYQGKLYQPTGLYRWFKQQRQVNKAAVFFFTIAVSQQQGYASESDLQAEGIQVAYEGGGSHQGENFAAPTFDTDVVNMKNAKIEGIWDAMDTGSNAKLCQAMDRQGFQVKAKVSTIVVWGDKLGDDFSAPCRNTVYSPGASQPYSDTGNPLVSQFRSDFSKYQPGRKLHQWALEGWGMGLMFTKAAQTMGPNLTRKGWMDWLNNLKDYTLDGLINPMDYKPQDYNGPKHDCFSIAQWQDAQRTFVMRAPITTCLEAKWVGTGFADDGA